MDDVRDLLNENTDRISYTTHQAGQSFHSIQQQPTGIFNSETAEAVIHFIMQQWIAGATCVISLLIVISTIAAGGVSATNGTRCSIILAAHDFAAC